MQRVRAAARLTPMRIAAAAPAVAVAAALALVLVPSGPDAKAPLARRPGPPGVATIGGKALQSARCRHWQGATAREKDAVVATLAYVVGGMTPYGPASTLPPTAAHGLFDRACTRPYARGFLLYELYTRAAAFYRTPQRRL